MERRTVHKHYPNNVKGQLYIDVQRVRTILHRIVFLAKFGSQTKLRNNPTSKTAGSDPIRWTSPPWGKKTKFMTDTVDKSTVKEKTCSCSEARLKQRAEPATAQLQHTGSTLDMYGSRSWHLMAFHYETVGHGGVAITDT